MTEDEAKTKWCPFVRVASLHESKNPREWIGVAGANRAVSSNVVEKKGVGEDGLPEAARCIGSACMAWRFFGGSMKPVRVHPSVLKDNWKGWAVTDPTPDDKGYVQISPPVEATGQGFCGLAGAPQ